MVQDLTMSESALQLSILNPADICTWPPNTERDLLLVRDWALERHHLCISKEFLQKQLNDAHESIRILQQQEEESSAPCAETTSVTSRATTVKRGTSSSQTSKAGIHTVGVSSRVPLVHLGNKDLPAGCQQKQVRRSFSRFPKLLGREQPQMPIIAMPTPMNTKTVSDRNKDVPKRICILEVPPSIVIKYESMEDIDSGYATDEVSSGGESSAAPTRLAEF